MFEVAITFATTQCPHTDGGGVRATLARGDAQAALAPATPSSRT